jgi:hypothetical protein
MQAYCCALALTYLLCLWLQEEAAVQASWCAHLHAKYFSSATGSLATLNLSNSLAHSLWAISLVRSRTFSGEQHCPQVIIQSHITPAGSL